MNEVETVWTLEVGAAALIDTLVLLKPVVPLAQRTAMPVLSAVRFAPDTAKGVVAIGGTDLGTSLEVLVAARYPSPDSLDGFCVNYEALNTALKIYVDSPEETVVFRLQPLTVKGVGKTTPFSVRLEVYPSADTTGRMKGFYVFAANEVFTLSDFPTPHRADGNADAKLIGTWDADTFVGIEGALRPYWDKEGNRFALTAVNFMSDGTRTSVMATDGYRVAWVSSTLLPVVQGVTLTPFGETLRLVTDVLEKMKKSSSSKARQVQVYLLGQPNSQKVMFVLDNHVTLVAKMMTEKYPDYLYSACLKALRAFSDNDIRRPSIRACFPEVDTPDEFSDPVRKEQTPIIHLCVDARKPKKAPSFGNAIARLSKAKIMSDAVALVGQVGARECRIETVLGSGRHAVEADLEELPVVSPIVETVQAFQIGINVNYLGQALETILRLADESAQGRVVIRVLGDQHAGGLKAKGACLFESFAQFNAADTQALPPTLLHVLVMTMA